MYLSKQAKDILDAADTGPYGSCVFASRSDELLAESLAHAGLMVRVDRLTFRTNDKGRKRLAQKPIVPQ